MAGWKNGGILMYFYAIRGAVTADANISEEIIDNTEKLLKEMYEKNELKQNEIISVIFSMTKDLNAAFPAVAARNLGWTNTALMCTNEIDVPGSLSRCIRILMHISTQNEKKQIKHIYQKGAIVLRPDLYNE